MSVFSDNETMAPNFSRVQRQLIFDAIIKHSDEVKYRSRGLSVIIQKELQELRFTCSSNQIQTYIRRFEGLSSSGYDLECIHSTLVGEWNYHR